MNSNQSLQLMISQPKKKKKTPLKNLQKKKRIPGRGEIGGGGEERNGSPIVLRPNLVISQLLRQIGSRNHPPQSHAPPRSVDASSIYEIRFIDGGRG